MNRSRTLGAALVAATAVGAALLLPAQADASAGSVHLHKIYYDSPGVDRRSNASLNAEYVQISNTTSKSASLRGWTLTDASRHTYTFGAYTLGAHKTVTVHTGKGSNTSANRYQNRAAYVWNNDKDTATLRSGKGAKVDVCSYHSTRVDYTMC